MQRFGCTSSVKKNTAAPQSLCKLVQRNNGFELFARIFFNGERSGHVLIHNDSLDIPGSPNAKSKLVKCLCVNCKDIDITASPFPRTETHDEVHIKHISTWDETKQSFPSVGFRNQNLAKIIVKDRTFHNVFIRRELTKPDSILNSMCVECEAKFTRVYELVKHFMKSDNVNLKHREKSSIKKVLFPAPQMEAESSKAKKGKVSGGSFSLIYGRRVIQGRSLFIPNMQSPPKESIHLCQSQVLERQGD